MTILPDQRALDPRTLEKVRKVWAMRGSAHAGERAAAEVKAAEIVVRFGYTLDQVEHLLATNGEPYPAAGEESRKQDQRNGTWHRQQQEDDRRRFQRWASRREAVIRRYGNLEAAVAWQPREKLLRQAVEHLCDVEAVSPDWVHLLDGWDDGIDDKPTRRIIELVCKSYPLPTSITDAQAEYDHWEERGRDWVAIFPYHEYSDSDFQLDLPSLLRYQIVTNLLETDLRAASVGEVLLRQRNLSELEHLDDIQKAILKDLEYLASIEACGTVQNGQSTNSSSPHQTTTQRRTAVEDLLSKMDTRLLPDREIARRVGVSPQTVGNIRRRLDQADPEFTRSKP